MYEIFSFHSENFPDDIERFYQDPQSAQDDLARLRHRFPQNTFTLLKDGILFNEAKLSIEIRNYEIQVVADASNRVPSGYRHGWGTDNDDFAADGGGAVRVWRPPNPEDSGE